VTASPPFRASLPDPVIEPPAPATPRWWPPLFLRRRTGELIAQQRPASFGQLCDLVAAALLPVLAVAVAVLLLLAALFRPLPEGSATSLAASVTLAITGGVLLIGAAMAKRSGAMAGNAHQVAAVMLILAALGLTVAMVTAGSLAETVYVQLLCICAGVVLLKLRWLLIGLVAIWFLWLGAAAFLAGSIEPGGYLLAMIGATVIALLVNAARLSALMSLLEAADAARSTTIRDQATGLLNRRGIEEVGAELMALGRRFREPVSCTVVEVETDPVHAPEGTRVQEADAAEVAVLLVPAFRESDALARWDVDRFAVLALGSGPRTEDIERRVQTQIGGYGADNTLQVFSGRAVKMPWQDETVTELVDRAFAEVDHRRRISDARFGDDPA
jgi:GGDEF domain-containing protein